MLTVNILGAIADNISDGESRKVIFNFYIQAIVRMLFILSFFHDSQKIFIQGFSRNSEVNASPHFLEDFEEMFLRCYIHCKVCGGSNFTQYYFSNYKKLLPNHLVITKLSEEDEIFLEICFKDNLVDMEALFHLSIA